MPITFHCENCKKKINAPDDAGGKWGKCPFCNHRCYIPLPPSDNDEELKLAPVDESEETQYQRMMRETHNITKTLLHQKQEPPDTGPARNAGEKEPSALIIDYLRLMADGSLDEANKVAEKIIPYKAAAKTVLENLLNAKMPEPELANVPKKVLEAFIKNLIKRI